MMTRLVKLLFFIGLGLLIASLIAPSFIDWNQHKPEVMAQIQPYFQRKVTVAGNVSFKILPQPEIMLQSVSIANAAGVKEPLLTLKSMEARLKLEPLLEGRIEIENINLTEPVLNLEVTADGKTNLSGVLTPSNNPGVTASAIKLNQVTIDKGTLRYTSQLTGLEKIFSELDLSVAADTLLGPYKITGKMLYQKTGMNINISTGILDKNMSASTHIDIMPTSGDLPHIKLSGDMNLHNGLDIEGELSLEQGKLGSLINVASLNMLDFMNENIDMTGTLQFRGDQLSLNEIKAKFNKTGTLKGKASVQFSRKGKTFVQADVEGAGLIVTADPSDTYINVPPEFQGSLRFKGKNIVWDGRHLNGADIFTTFNDKEWTIKSASAVLPGDTQVKFAGTIAPGTNSAAYTSLQITTEDLGKLVDDFKPGDASIFSALGGPAAPFRKLEMTSGLNTTPAKISFFNIDATIDDKKKLSGVLNVERVTTKKNVTAKLHLSQWDSAAFSDAFLQTVLKSDADLELTADNFTRGALKIADLSFKGNTDGQGLVIQDLSGHLSDKDSFSLAGHVATLAPLVTGFDASYTLKSARVIDVVKNLGIDLPPLSGDNFDLKGTVKGEAGKFAITVEGSSDTLVPWQGLSVIHPSFTVGITPTAVRISELAGTLWDSKLQANIVYDEQMQPVPSWSSTFKGSLKQVDLQKLQDALNINGVKSGTGDIDFELASADNSPSSAIGNIVLHAQNVTIDKFNADKLYDTLHQLTAMPDNFQQIIEDAFHKNGPSVFRNVDGKFKMNHDKADIDTLSLSNAAETIALSGTADIATGNYKISGDLKLAKPEGFPSLKVTRNSEDTDYKVDSKQLESYVIKNLPKAPPAALHNPVTTPQLQKPASKQDQSINDILKRLDENDNTPPSSPVPPTAAQPQPKPPAAPTPPQTDSNKIIQQMQLQEMIQQNSTLPLPLTPSAH